MMVDDDLKTAKYWGIGDEKPSFHPKGGLSGAEVAPEPVPVEPLAI